MGKRAKPEEIVAKLRQVEVLTAQGKSIAEAVRSIGVVEHDRVPGRGVAWRHSRHDLRQRRAGQTATAGRLTRGSSLKGATLSTVM